MNRVLLIIPFLFLVILFAGTSCGKKTPPFLPKKEFSAKVANLRGEWVKGNILLKGDISGLKKPKRALGQIKGARVYYGQYPLKTPPCDGCPIEYHGDHEFGAEVITEEGFFCKVPVEKKGQIIFLKVHLFGPEGAMGPPSNRVKVIVK